MCWQDYNSGQSSHGRCTATDCRCPSVLYLLNRAECTCSSRRGLNRWPDSGRVLYACAPRCSKDLALRMQCVRNTERNRAPLSRFLGFNINLMAGTDREPFSSPRKACMPVQMTAFEKSSKTRPPRAGPYLDHADLFDISAARRPPELILGSMGSGQANFRSWYHKNDTSRVG